MSSTPFKEQLIVELNVGELYDIWSSVEHLTGSEKFLWTDTLLDRRSLCSVDIGIMSNIKTIVMDHCMKAQPTKGERKCELVDHFGGAKMGA